MREARRIGRPSCPPDTRAGLPQPTPLGAGGRGEDYRDAFDCTVVSRDKDRIWLACGERTRPGIWSPGPKEFGDQGGTHVHFALSAGPRRLDAIVERLTRAGIAFLGPVEHPGGDRSIYVDDPEGNVVEVWDFFDHGDGASQGVDALA
jgi:hypothetical protein